MASRKGSVKIVRALVQHGASVNHTNKVSYTSFQSVYTVIVIHQYVQRLHVGFLTGVGVG